MVVEGAHLRMFRKPPLPTEEELGSTMKATWGGIPGEWLDSLIESTLARLLKPQRAD